MSKPIGYMPLMVPVREIIRDNGHDILVPAKLDLAHKELSNTVCIGLAFLAEATAKL